MPIGKFRKLFPLNPDLQKVLIPLRISDKPTTAGVSALTQNTYCSRTDKTDKRALAVSFPIPDDAPVIKIVCCFIIFFS